MRVGFCCLYLGDDTVPSMRTTTRAWLNRQSRIDAERKLDELMVHNLNAVYSLVSVVGNNPQIKRMVRLSSDILPLYTEPTWSYFYQQTSVRAFLESQFARIGALARELDVRLSFHPGQFTVLASDTPSIVDNSIAEFEYHCDMIRMMGYGLTFQDFKCNVHISGRLGAQGIIDVLPRLSVEARNCITIENSETTWGIDESLKLVDHCALVLDIHHHWVRDGEHIQPDDPRVLRIIDSWRGVRPVIHYSSPKEDILALRQGMPDHAYLLESGITKSAMRAHSDYYTNQDMNNWAASFLPQFDIQTESKAKNLARDAFLENINIGVLNG
jgi:UV DNA damage endonuclease